VRSIPEGALLPVPRLSPLHLDNDQWLAVQAVQELPVVDDLEAEALVIKELENEVVPRPSWYIGRVAVLDPSLAFVAHVSSVRPNDTKGDVCRTGLPTVRPEPPFPSGLGEPVTLFNGRPSIDSSRGRCSVVAAYGTVDPLVGVRFPAAALPPHLLGLRANPLGVVAPGAVQGAALQEDGQRVPGPSSMAYLLKLQATHIP
jgi:hypothetical protein